MALGWWTGGVGAEWGVLGALELGRGRAGATLLGQALYTGVHLLESEDFEVT